MSDAARCRVRIDRPGDVHAAGRHRQRAEFRGVGAEFVQRHRDGDHGARCHPDIGSGNREFRRIGIVEGFGGAADDLGKIGAGPSRLQQEVVSPPERQQPAFDRVLCVFGARRTLRRLCEAMALTVASVFLMRWCSSSRISFCSLSDASRSLGVDAGLREQRLGVDFRLRQQQPKADILRRQKLLRARCASEAIGAGLDDDRS